MNVVCLDINKIIINILAFILNINIKKTGYVRDLNAKHRYSFIYYIFNI